jgi:hypothetical protein
MSFSVNYSQTLQSVFFHLGGRSSFIDTNCWLYVVGEQMVDLEYKFNNNTKTMSVVSYWCKPSGTYHVHMLVDFSSLWNIVWHILQFIYIKICMYSHKMNCRLWFRPLSLYFADCLVYFYRFLWIFTSIRHTTVLMK